MVTKYHYSVHIVPKTQDFSIWVGVTINQPYAGDSTSLVEEDSELWNTAIARARELCPSLGDCFCEEWDGGDPVYSYTRISEEQRLLAQRLWNEYNATLAQHGMTLHYDGQNGSFFVASTDLVPGRVGEDGLLPFDELAQVVVDGGFDGQALNNPPWFTDYSDYSLKTK